MQKVNLYRYEINGVVIVTPNKRSETDTPSRMRLIADENCILINGTMETPAVDVALEDIGLWSEIAETDESIDFKAQAYDILIGVSE